VNSEAFPREHPQQERSDIHLSAVLLGAVAVIVMILAAALIAKLVLGLAGPPQRAPNADAARATLLSSDPVSEQQAFRGEKQQQLESYGWIDRDHNIAHVPIERAMQMLVTQHTQPQEQP